MVSYCSPCDFGWMVCPVDVESVVIFNKVLVCFSQVSLVNNISSLLEYGFQVFYFMAPLCESFYKEA